MDQNQIDAVQAILDLSICRYRDRRITDVNVIHDLQQIVRLSLQCLGSKAAIRDSDKMIPTEVQRTTW